MQQICIRLFNHKTFYANVVQGNNWFAPECLAAVIRHSYLYDIKSFIRDYKFKAAITTNLYTVQKNIFVFESLI